MDTRTFILGIVDYLYVGDELEIIKPPEGHEKLVDFEKKLLNKCKDLNENLPIGDMLNYIDEKCNKERKYRIGVIGIKSKIFLFEPFGNHLVRFHNSFCHFFSFIRNFGLVKSKDRLVHKKLSLAPFYMVVYVQSVCQM